MLAGQSLQHGQSFSKFWLHVVTTTGALSCNGILPMSLLGLVHCTQALSTLQEVMWFLQGPFCRLILELSICILGHFKKTSSSLWLLMWSFFVLMLVLQVTQQSAVGYLQKFAGQPVLQLPAAQSIQQQFLPPSTVIGSKPGKNSAPGNHNGQKGSPAAKAGSQTALKLPLLRPAPPVLEPFAGQPCNYNEACGAITTPLLSHFHAQW